jgi:Fe2+ transport system protein B
MDKHQNPKKGGGGILLSMALGAALAAGAGYYATHKEQVDRHAKKKIDLLAKKFQESRPQIEKKVKEIWGKVSNEAVATYIDLKASVLKALEDENVERTGKTLKETYDMVVDSVMESARKSGVLNKETEAKIAEVFKQDWKKIGKNIADNANKFAKVAKNKVAAAKRGAQKAKKPARKASKPAVKSTKKAAKPVKKAAARKPTKKASKK